MQSEDYLVANREVDRVQRIVERLIESHASPEELSTAVDVLRDAKQSLDQLTAVATAEERESVSIELVLS